MYSSLQDADGSPLSVEREKWHSSSAFLKDQHHVYGKLIYEGKWNPVIRAEISGQSWIFKEKGIFAWTLFIMDDRGSEIARLKRNWTGSKGTLTFVDGREMTLRSVGFWKSDLVWNDPQYGEVVRLETKAMKSDMLVHINDRKYRHALLLALISVYTITTSRKAAATA